MSGAESDTLVAPTAQQQRQQPILCDVDTIEAWAQTPRALPPVPLPERLFSGTALAVPEMAFRAIAQLIHDPAALLFGRQRFGHSAALSRLMAQYGCAGASMAVSPKGDMALLVRGRGCEIRLASDDFAPPNPGSARELSCCLPSEPNSFSSVYRRVAWAHDASHVVVASSSGHLAVLGVESKSGSLVLWYAIDDAVEKETTAKYGVDGNDGMMTSSSSSLKQRKVSVVAAGTATAAAKEFNLCTALAGLALAAEPGRASRLITLSYGGHLRTLFLDEPKTPGMAAYVTGPAVDVSSTTSDGTDFCAVGALTLVSKASLVIVGGAKFARDAAANRSTVTGREDEESEGMACVRAWRLVGEAPYLVAVDVSVSAQGALEDNNVNQIATPAILGCVHALAVSPSEQKLVALDTAGTVRVYSLPSLRLLQTWSPEMVSNACVACDEVRPNPSAEERTGPTSSTQASADDGSNANNAAPASAAPLVSVALAVAWWSESELVLAHSKSGVNVVQVEGGTETVVATGDVNVEEASLLHPRGRLDAGSVGVTAALSGLSPAHMSTVAAASTTASKNNIGTATATAIARSTSARQPITPRACLVLGCVQVVEPVPGAQAGDESGLLAALAWRLSGAPALAPRIPQRARETISLTRMQSLSPQRLLGRLLDSEQWRAASVHARRFGLDPDAVSMAQWRRAPVSAYSIRDCLSRVSNDVFVVNECLACETASRVVAARLTELGLERTARHCVFGTNAEETETSLATAASERTVDNNTWSPPSNLTPAQLSLCAARAVFFARCVRLETYNLMCRARNTKFSATGWRLFRDGNIFLSAAKYATQCNVEALEVVLTQHAQELRPHVLALLSMLPATAEPRHLKRVLPFVNESECDEGALLKFPLALETAIMRAEAKSKAVTEDWVMHPAIQHALSRYTGRWPRPGSSDDASVLYCENSSPVFGNTDTGSVALTSTTQSPLAVAVTYDAAAVGSWYASRALAADSIGLVDTAFSWAAAGVASNAPGLDDLLVDLRHLSTLVYECGAGDDIDLAGFRSLGIGARLKAAMRGVSSKEFATELARRALPMLPSDLDAEDRAGAITNLVLARMSAGQTFNAVGVSSGGKQEQDENILFECLSVCRQSSPASGVPENLRALPMPAHLIEFALACISGALVTGKPPPVATISDIFELMPAPEAMPATQRTSQLQAKLDRLDGALMAIEVLQKYGLQREAVSALSRALGQGEERRRDEETNDESAEKEELARDKQSSVRSAGSDTLETLMTKVCHRAAHIEPKGGTNSCDGLLHDLITLVGGTANMSSGVESRIHSLYVGALLRRGRQIDIELARSHLADGSSCPLTEHEAALAVLGAAREHYNAALDINDPALVSASACLELLPTAHTGARMERRLISAHAGLAKLGLRVPPAAVRVTHNRRSFLKRVLSEHRDAYKQSDAVMRIAVNLGLVHDDNREGGSAAVNTLEDSNTPTEEGGEYDSASGAWTIFEMLIDAAIAKGDLAYAGQYAMRAIRAGEPEIWEAAWRVATSSSAVIASQSSSVLSTMASADLTQRLACVGFVIKHGPSHVLSEALDVFRVLELAQVCARANVTADFDSLGSMQKSFTGGFLKQIL